MKRILLLGFSLAALGIAFAGSINAQIRRLPSDGGTEPPRCLADATIQISASPAAVTHGQSSTVHWSVGLPSGCSTVHVRLNQVSVANSGSRSVVPSRTATYILLVSQTQGGVYGERSASTSVEVSYPPRVVIDPSTIDPVGVLLGALGSGNPEQTVELCDVDLDLTGKTDIVIGDNRSLVASPACA